METNNEWIEIGMVRCINGSHASYEKLMVKNVFGHLVYVLRYNSTNFNVLIGEHTYGGAKYNAKAGDYHFCFTPIA